MKTLIIVVHPKMQKSLINKRWVEELNKFPEKYTVHQLYENYPDENIDIEKEQKYFIKIKHLQIKIQGIKNTKQVIYFHFN